MSLQVARLWKHLNIRRRENAYNEPAHQLNMWHCEVELINKSQSGTLFDVKLLICEGADVNKKADNGDTALLVACDRGHLEIVQYLLRHNACVSDRDTRKQTPLHRVRVGAHHHDILIDLLEAGADIDADDFDFGTPLHLACVRGEARKVECLLALGAKLNTTNISGATALHLACSVGAMEIVQRLLSAGANVGLRTDAWLAPLHVACYNGHLNVAQLLVEHGALVAGGDLGTRDGVTPLHIACINNRGKNNVKIVEFLLHAGDANIPDSSGATALHYACRHLSEAVMPTLVRHGANVNASDWRGRGVLTYLMRNGYRCRHDEFIFELWHESCNQDIVRMLRTLLDAGLALPSTHDDSDDDSCYMDPAMDTVEEEDDDDDDDVMDELSRDDIDEMSMIQKHAVVVKWLLKAGASLESLCADSETLFFEDFIALSDVEELPILAAWCRWRVAAGLAIDGANIAASLTRRVNLLASTDDAMQLDDSDREGGELATLVAKRRTCCQTVRADAEWIRHESRNARSLVHLARTAIRNRLASISNNCSIFPLVDALPLPRIVRDLVKLSDLEPCDD